MGSFTRAVGCVLAVAVSVGAVGSAGAAVATQPMMTWQANGRVSAIAIGRGVAYLGGQFTAMISPTGRVVRRNHLAAVDIASGKLLGWNPNANGNVDVVRAVGGVVYVGGQFSAVRGVARRDLAAVGPTRGTVLRWAVSADGPVDAMTALGSTLYIGGAFTHVDGVARPRLAAISTSGALNPSWKPAADATVRVLLADATTGRVYTGGDFSRISGVSTPYLAALGRVRGLVHPFSARPTGRVWGLSTDAGGLYAAIGGHVPAGEVAAYDATTGAPRWSRWTDGDVQTISARAGTVYAGGHFVNACADHSGGGSPWVCTTPIARAKLAAFSERDGTLGSWAPTCDSEYGVWALRTTPGDLLIGGDFKHVSGQHRWHFAEFVG